MGNDSQNLARIGYEGYAKKTGGFTFDGRRMPEWDALPQNIKDAWAAAAKDIGDAVQAHVLRLLVEGGLVGAIGTP